MADERQHDVEQFLYFEARLLDSWRLHEWLELLTDDIRYWVPIRESVPDGEELDPTAVAVAHIDEDRRGLELRVARFDTGAAHAEIPPSRLRHFVTNVEIVHGHGHELEVASNFLLYQGRRDGSDQILSGQRRDHLRTVTGSLRLASRTVLLDHTLLPRALSVIL